MTSLPFSGVQARGERHVGVPPRAAVEEQGRRRQDAPGVQVPRAPRQLLWYAAQENSAQQEANVGGGGEETQRRRKYTRFVLDLSGWFCSYFYPVLV